MGLDVGDNVIQVEVTAEDGSTATYRVTVTREDTTAMCLAPDLTGRTEIWTGTVTVAPNVFNGDLVSYGYGYNWGALAPQLVRIGTNSYTVDTADVRVAGQFRFSWNSPLAAADSEGLVLHVCADASFAFADASFASTTHTHTWADSGLDWSAVTTRVLYLSVPTPEPGLELSKSSLGPTEGASESYKVALATQPSDTVTVTITGHSGTDLTLDKTSLTFTTTNWAAEQEVTVTAEQDDDTADDEVTLTHTASGGGYGSVAEDLPVTVDDDDPGLELSKSLLDPTEGGSESYKVALATQPSDTVTVTITGHSGTDLTLDKTSLTFTTTNWATAQEVTVTAGQDDDTADDEVTLTHTASGGGYGSVAEDLPVTVDDDDDPGLELSKTSLGPTEGGSESYKVALATQPSDTVTVTITGHSGTDLTLDKTSLTFTTTNWATAQTVTVTANPDDDAVDDEVTLTHTASGGGYGSVAEDLDVTVDDDDTDTERLVLTVEAVNDEVTEGEPVRYRIRMSRRTSGAVVESVFSYEGDFVRNPNSLVVSGINSHRAYDDGLSWVVSYDTVDDAVVEKDGSFTVTIRHPAVIQLSNGDDFDQYSHGEGYAVGSPSTATVKILDNDGGAPPNAPPRPGVTVVSPTILDATWGAAPENGTPVTGYILEYRAGPSGQWTGWPEAIAPAARAVRLTGLAPGTDYGVRVRAKSVRGEGPWSAVGSADTAQDPGVRVSISVEKGSSQTEGATLVFRVRANPAPASALRVDLRVTETLEMLSGAAPPTSVTVPAGQRSATFEVRTRDDKEDEGYSEVTAELRPSARYLLGTAREAMYRVHDDEPDTVRGAVENPRVEAILDPAWSPEEQALFEKPIRRLRFTWDPPTDVCASRMCAAGGSTRTRSIAARIRRRIQRIWKTSGKAALSR